MKALTAELRHRLRRFHGLKGKRVILTFWVTERNRCWETRDLKDGKDDERRIAADVYENPVRDFTKFLNEDGWGALMRKLSR